VKSEDDSHVAQQKERTVKGVVNGVAFTPGRGDRLLQLNVEGCQYSQFLIADDQEGSDLNANGSPLDYGQLLSWLVANRCEVTLYPRTDRYGAATKAEFTTLTEKDAG
jgi:hypothetical protein